MRRVQCSSPETTARILRVLSVLFLFKHPPLSYIQYLLLSSLQHLPLSSLQHLLSPLLNTAIFNPHKHSWTGKRFSSQPVRHASLLHFRKETNSSPVSSTASSFSYSSSFLSAILNTFHSPLLNTFHSFLFNTFHLRHYNAFNSRR